MIANSLLNEIDAAELLNPPIRTVRKLAKSKSIPHIRLPNDEFRFVRSDVESWLELLKGEPEMSSA